jgi:hypothetical protein
MIPLLDVLHMEATPAELKMVASYKHSSAVRGHQSGSLLSAICRGMFDAGTTMRTRQAMWTFLTTTELGRLSFVCLETGVHAVSPLHEILQHNVTATTERDKYASLLVSRLPGEHLNRYDSFGYTPLLITVSDEWPRTLSALLQRYTEIDFEQRRIILPANTHLNPSDLLKRWAIFPPIVVPPAVVPIVAVPVVQEEKDLVNLHFDLRLPYEDAYRHNSSKMLSLTDEVYEKTKIMQLEAPKKTKWMLCELCFLSSEVLKLILQYSALPTINSPFL